MSFRIHCPNGHPVRVHEEQAGKSGLCPHCGAQVRVPGVAQPADHLPRHDHAIGVTVSDPLSAPFPVRQKTKLCVGCGKNVSQSFAICPRCGTPLMTYHHLNVSLDGDVVVAGLVDHQIRDKPVIDKIAEELLHVAAQAQQLRLVVDLSRVLHLSVLMLEKLVMVQLAMKKRKGDVVLRNIGAEVRETLATTKLQHMFHEEEVNVSDASA
jgi:anti-anti-sigma regulatory factor